MEVSLLQIMKTKKLTKTACSSRVIVQYVNEKNFHFYKGYFTNLYKIKTLVIKQLCPSILRSLHFTVDKKNWLKVMF